MVVAFGTGDQEEHRCLAERRRQSSECGDTVGPGITDRAIGDNCAGKGL